MPADADAAPDTRQRILDAALGITRIGGLDAVTTRAVALAASVQVPTIYRLFGDKHGLLDAVAEHGVQRYVAAKGSAPTVADPIEQLRLGWQGHVAFGLANPALFAIMSSKPQSPAAAQGLRLLKVRVRAIASAGRLRTSEERAVSMLHACCVGLVLTLIAEGKTEAPDLSSATCEAVLSTITTDSNDHASVSQQTAAATLRATLDSSTRLSRGERFLLDELLERLANEPLIQSNSDKR